MANKKPARKTASKTNATKTATSTAQPTINVTVQTGKLEDKSLAELLGLLAGGDRSPELMQIIRGRTNNLACYVRGEDGKLDVAETMECLEAVQEGGPRQMWGNVVVESLEEFIDKQREADPVTGEMLTKGVASSGADWSNVPEQNRVLAAYAALTNQLAGTDIFTIVTELEKPKPTGRWVRIQALFAQAKKTNPEMVAAAQARLVYRGKRQNAQSRSDTDSIRLPGTADYNPQRRNF